MSQHDATKSPRGPRREGPEWITLYLLCALTISVTFADYLTYRHDGAGNQMLYMDVITGTAPAPEQYRTGVTMTGYWLAQLAHVPMRYTLGGIDLLAGTAAVVLLYRTFRHRAMYRDGSPLLRWMASMALVALASYFVVWAPWYNRPATLPILALTVLIVALWTPSEAPSDGRSSLLRAGGLALATLLLSTVRAELAAILGGTAFLMAVFGRARRLSLGRGPAAATAAVQMLLAVSFQLYMMKVRYPQATYGSVPVVMLIHEPWDPLSIFPFELIIVPFLWVSWHNWQQRRDLSGVDMLCFVAAWVYLPVWLVLGASNEVRIFLPMMVLLIPRMVELLVAKVPGRASDDSSAVPTMGRETGVSAGVTAP